LLQQFIIAGNEVSATLFGKGNMSGISYAEPECAKYFGSAPSGRQVCYDPFSEGFKYA